MYKKLASLFTILFFSTFGYADDSNQSNAGPSQQVNEKTNDLDSEIAQGDSNARWYKSREGRREYLKGGTDYPGGNQGAEHHQVSPSSDARWYKSREGRQEYLKGGANYPGGDQDAEHHQVSPSSDARWYKNRPGRQEYLRKN